MGFTPSQRLALLQQWIQPSSSTEQDQQERAERMIRQAVMARSSLSGCNLAVYAKGSYPNNTNVRRDSDVDIVVENRECWYYDYFPGVTTPASSPSAYTGNWTPALWRSEVTQAITDCFGAYEVDASGEVAIVVAAKVGSRPSADVIPSFGYYRYDNPQRTAIHQGSKVFKRTSGSLVNWPQQQLDNGRAKNTATNRRYKNYVRALKNAENTLVKASQITAKPSYLMECLVWNVPNATLTIGDLDDGFRATLVWLWTHLNEQYRREDWDEPNRLKYLFGGHQKWTPDDAKELVSATLVYLYA